MTPFTPVVLYSMDGTFLAYAIMGEHKLQSTNIWVEGEEETFQARLSLLNSSSLLNQHWPLPSDPDVQAILSRDDFMPITYKTASVVDEDASDYVYKEKVGRDEQDRLIMVQDDEIDEERSTVVYKTVQVPERPTDAVTRIKAACEIVAKQRAGV